MKKFVAVVVVALTTVLCSAAEIYSTVDAAGVMSIMRENGYTVRLDSENDILWTLDGIKSSVIFNDGKKQNTNMYYRCSFTIDKNKLAEALSLSNTFNRTRKFGKSYVSGDSVVFQLTLNANKGITKERLVDFLDDCKVFGKQWKKEVVDKL